MAINNLFPLIAAFSLILEVRATAQTFTTLHNFIGYPDDGAMPMAGLILSGNTLYGTTPGGGGSGSGTVFAICTDGSAFTNLYSFTARPFYPGPFANSDGNGPYAGLILSENTLYGTAAFGGTGDSGIVFKVNTNGTCFTNLHNFTASPGPYPSTNSDGAGPYGLILSGGNLYGTTADGGSSGYGTVFAMNTDGSGFTTLHGFNYSDGASPNELVLSSNTLYGTTYMGGSSGNGTVFALNANGAGFTNLHDFSEVSVSSSTNSDGANPSAGLTLSGNTLFGTTVSGGSSGNGTIFALNTNGAGFTNLHDFSGGLDGMQPEAGLIISDNTLYGTASGGGSSSNGTIYAFNTDGTGFTNVYSFTGSMGSQPPLTNSDGAHPYARLFLSGKILYGTAVNGGSSGVGTVFSLSYAPQLTIIPTGANVLLIWLANYAGFDYNGYTLQSTTNLGLLGVWHPVVPEPVIINGEKVVTNPVSGTQQFYRLVQ